MAIGAVIWLVGTAAIFGIFSFIAMENYFINERTDNVLRTVLVVGIIHGFFKAREDLKPKHPQDKPYSNYTGNP